jgi:hypothetical protein
MFCLIHIHENVSYSLRINGMKLQTKQPNTVQTKHLITKRKQKTKRTNIQISLNEIRIDFNDSLIKLQGFHWVQRLQQKSQVIVRRHIASVAFGGLEIKKRSNK